MSFHFCTHPWEIRDVPAGIEVALTRRDLEPSSAATLVEDLIELVRENGKRDLHLDLAEVSMVPSVIIGKMVALHARLQEHGGRLIVVNLDPTLHDSLRTSRLCDVIEMQPRVAGDTDAGSLF